MSVCARMHVHECVRAWKHCLKRILLWMA